MKQRKTARRRTVRAAKHTTKGSDEASAAIKRLAAKQKVRISLDDEQLDAIVKQWIAKNPQRPAEITFYAAGRPAINVKVAGYWYSGNTCCV